MKNEKNAAPVIIDWLGLLQGNEIGAYNRREMLDALNDYRARVSGRRGDSRSRNIDRALEVKGSEVRRAVAELVRYSPRPNTCGAFACGADLCPGCANPTRQPIAPGLSVPETLDALRPILDRVIKSVYLPEYRAKVTDAEALGVLIAKFFKWDGSNILAAVYSALEDANYHADNRIIERMQKGEDLDALIKDMAKELSAMHSQYCKDCAGGCPTLELIKRAKGE